MIAGNIVCMAALFFFCFRADSTVQKVPGQEVPKIVLSRRQIVILSSFFSTRERERERERNRQTERERQRGGPRPVKGALREGEESNLQITFTMDGRADSPCDARPDI